MNVLVLNAGSSSLKYKLFQGGAILDSGTVERTGTPAQAAEQALRHLLDAGRKIEAIGYRVVHGGQEFREATRVTPEILARIRALGALAPLHNPMECDMIEAGMRRLPAVPAVAVFDTAFHATLPEVAFTYALPQALREEEGLRRYGFHGISYRYVSERLFALWGRGPQDTRVVICHLGSGASACALQGGRSVDTSMGITPLEGLVMGTRSGDIDPGLLLHLLRVRNMDPATLDDLLNYQSGLKGLSGRSNDVRDLEAAVQSGEAKSELALEVFAYRVRKYIGAYAAALGGLDALVFTGGIGEHSPGMRERICRNLEYLGLVWNSEANGAANGSETALHAPESRLAVWVVPTDEERQIARETAALIQNSPS